MLASYRDNPAPFSIDLVGAVSALLLLNLAYLLICDHVLDRQILRQTTFTSKIFALGWLDPSNPNPPLVQSITRYHNFLHLLAKFQRQFLVPTLDIDLGWHTHQLSGGAYMSDTKRCVGRHVDHDDKVEEGVLCKFIFLCIALTSWLISLSFQRMVSTVRHACGKTHSTSLTRPANPFSRRTPPS